MAVESLLSKLDHVKRIGPGKWIARCPAHDDRRASLSIRELDDSRVLLHDFAGCSVESVLAAVGLTFSDLMPEKLGDHKREARPFSAADALRCIGFETLLVAMTASRMAAGEAIDSHARDRLMLAAARIRGALDGAGL